MFYNQTVLHDAIRLNNYEIATKICNSSHKNRYLNVAWLGVTPLHTSLMGKKHNFTILFLKHGADPNQPSYANYWKGKPLEIYFAQEDKSLVTLLAFYGADINQCENIEKASLITNTEQNELYQSYLQGHRIYNKKQEILNLEQVLNNNSSLTASANSGLEYQINELNELRRQLSNLLSTVGQEETDHVIKTHYLEEAKTYLEPFSIEILKDKHSNKSQTSGCSLASLIKLWQRYIQKPTESESTSLLQIKPKKP